MEKSTPLLVLLPGLDGTGLLFERFLAELPPEFKTLIIPYPDDCGTTIEEHAAVARSLIPKEKIIILAESFSGLVAMNLLRAWDVDVEKIIFVASFAKSPRPTLRFFLPLFPLLGKVVRFVPKAALRMFCLDNGTSDAELNQLKNVIAHVNPATIAARLKLIASARASQGEPLNVPAYYLEPTQDRLVPKRSGKTLMSQFKECTAIPVRGPHFLLQAAPMECAKVVASILRDSSNPSL
jgi:pimeloyl-ACP methyl ester carboxylesterase